MTSQRRWCIIYPLTTQRFSQFYYEDKKDMITRFQRFSSAISAINKCILKIESDEMAKYGLRGSCALYLISMHDCEDGITAAKLSEKCGKDKAAVSRALAELIEKGLVLRASSFNDSSYRALLLLTDEGKRAAANVCERARIAAELGGKGLSEEERKIFYGALDLIGDNLQTLSAKGLPQ